MVEFDQGEILASIVQESKTTAPGVESKTEKIVATNIEKQPPKHTLHRSKRVIAAAPAITKPRSNRSTQSNSKRCAAKIRANTSATFKTTKSKTAGSVTTTSKNTTQ